MAETNDKCIICGSANLYKRKAFIASFLIERMFNNEVQNAELLICKNCGMHFFKPRPLEDHINRHYKDYMKESYLLHRQKFENGFYDLRKNFEDNILHKEIILRKDYLKKILNKHADISNIKNVLDYGGDKGQYIIDELADADKFVYEISGVKTINGIQSINKIEDLKKHKWDLIMCSHVLEHLSCPVDAIKLFSSILNQDGLLYIEAPLDLPRVLNIKYEIKRLIKPSFLYPVMHEHINYFQPKSFKKMLELNGFKVLCNKIVNSYFMFGRMKNISCLAKKGI